jgi:hypothetical protein
MNEEKTEDFDLNTPAEVEKFIDALCANIEDKKIRKETKKKLLFKLRSEHGAIV